MDRPETEDVLTNGLIRDRAATEHVRTNYRAVGGMAR